MIGDKALNAAALVVCPVPPFAIAIAVPFHTPVAIVPTAVKLDVTMAAGNAVPAKLAAGNPVVFVNVPLVGVPNIGVTNVGEVANTKDPEPVSSVTAVARLALDGVAKNVPTPVPNPDTPVDTGKPVQFVNTPLEGVPRAGVVNVGEVRVNPATVVVVVPNVRAVDPRVIAVAKLLSRLDNGIALVAVANVYGTAMLEPHS